MSGPELGTQDASVGAAGRPLPATVLQVGEGRFLRAFLGALAAEAREAGRFEGRLVLTAPRPGGAERLAALRARGGRYVIVVRGPAGESRVEIAPYDRIVDGFQESADLLAEVLSPAPLVVVSNTTEAGLAYRREDPARPETYPGRLTRWLDLRRRAGVPAPTAVVPCELLTGNARLLREAVLRHAADWGLPAGALLGSVSFVETLVDRIVTSEDPADPFACFTEPYMAFYLGGAPDWVREALPLDPRFVHWVADVAPARDRKVRLLNGTHTLMAVVGLPLGVAGVGEALGHPVLGPFLRAAMFEEGIGSFPPTERDPARAFALDTVARLQNPGIRDTLARLALQMTAKVGARWTPILEGCRRERGAWPERFAAGVAAYLRLAAGADSGGFDVAPLDDPDWIGRLRALWRSDDPAGSVAEAAAAPGWPVPRDPGLTATVAAHAEAMTRRGLAAHLAALA